jgi:hypothetical protein
LEMEAIEVSYIYIYESNEYMSLILGWNRAVELLILFKCTCNKETHTV